jgi:hypothetical protein
MAVEAFGDRTVVQPTDKLLASDSTAEAHINLSAGIRLREIPHLSFGLSVQGQRLRRRRVDLKREVLATIEDFDEPGEALARADRAAHQLLTVTLHQIPKRGSGQRPFRHYRLSLGTVGNLPGFADWHTGRQVLAPLLFQLATTPKALLRQRSENQRGLQHQAASVLGSVK